MAHIATAELASAVSNAGGLGIIGAANFEPEWLKEQIRIMRNQTDKPFGVNVIMISPFIEQVVEVVLAEKIDIVTTGAGNPGVYMSRFNEAGIKVMPLVASVALARRLERSGAAAVVAEGTESGGHIGETTTMALVPQVVDSVNIPVIAAGGIADGRGLVASLALGAQAVQMGTRFVCSEECIAHHNYKEKIIKAGDRSTMVTGQALGHPIRSIMNRLAKQFVEMEKSGASIEEMEAFGRGRVQMGLINGDSDEGTLLAGQISGLINEIKPVKAIIDDIVSEAEAIIANLENYHKKD